jgi:hypothetical protein
MRQFVKTVADGIEALGGVAAVATLCSVGDTAVYNWRRNNGFPPGTYVVLQRAFARRGVHAPDSLWLRMLKAKGSAMAAE